MQKAKTYQEQMAMSPSAIHDQLTSSYGEQFTKEQADYAIEHLNDWHITVINHKKSEIHKLVSLGFLFT